MEADLLKSWGPVLGAIMEDADLLGRVLADNEWFTPDAVALALAGMAPWFEGDRLAALRSRYPAVAAPRRIGLILAGNIPLVGLHDVLMVLLSGHHAVVKPSHKDRLLLQYMVAHAPATIRERLQLVEAIAPGDIDFLIATGSNATATQIEQRYNNVPQLIRKSRFSVALLQPETTAAQLGLLADDILRYHGLGCRSVSCVLVPVGYPLHALCERLENAAPHSFAVTWKTVLRYERAQLAMSGAKVEPCQAIIVQHADQVGPGRLGVLNIVTYSDRVAAEAMLAAAAADIQCIVGTEAVSFGQSQCPALDDFADGVDTLAILTRL